jgi:hypothetical protein
MVSPQNIMENFLDVKLDLAHGLVYHFAFAPKGKVDRGRRITVEYGRVGTLTIE